MPKNSNFSKPNLIYRVIDANINRTKEGLRVCEEITRFILNNYALTLQIKRIRHKLQLVFNRLKEDKFKLLKERNVPYDIGRHIASKEKKRNDYKDIFFANIQRVKESLRVLEEFSKLINKGTSEKFKDIRYKVYDIEKKVARKLKALCDTG